MARAIQIFQFFMAQSESTLEANIYGRLIKKKPWVESNESFFHQFQPFHPLESMIAALELFVLHKKEKFTRAKCSDLTCLGNCTYKYYNSALCVFIFFPFSIRLRYFHFFPEQHQKALSLGNSIESQLNQPRWRFNGQVFAKQIEFSPSLRLSGFIYGF